MTPQSSEPIGISTIAIGGAGGSCSATVSGAVPGDATAGDDDVSTAAVDSGALPVGGTRSHRQPSVPRAGLRLRRPGRHPSRPLAPRRTPGRRPPRRRQIGALVRRYGIRRARRQSPRASLTSQRRRAGVPRVRPRAQRPPSRTAQACSRRCPGGGSGSASSRASHCSRRSGLHSSPSNAGDLHVCIQTRGPADDLMCGEAPPSVA